MLSGSASGVDLTEARREASDDLLDRVCEAHGLEPVELRAVKEEKLVGWAKELLPPKGQREFQLPLFRRMLGEYVADYG